MSKQDVPLVTTIQANHETGQMFIGTTSEYLADMLRDKLGFMEVEIESPLPPVPYQRWTFQAPIDSLQFRSPDTGPSYTVSGKVGRA